MTSIASRSPQIEPVRKKTIVIPRREKALKYGQKCPHKNPLYDRDRAHIADAKDFSHAGTHVTLLIQELDVTIINAATGEILREATIDLTRDYQPRGTKK